MFPTSRRTEPPRGRVQLNVALAAALGLALLLAACTQEQPGLSLTIDQAVVELLRGAEDTEVLVTLSPTGGANGEVQLAVDGLPPGVTAAFSPTVLSGDNLTSILSLGASAGTEEGYGNLVISATGAGLEAETTLGLAVVGLTVSGTVHSPFAGPIAGAGIASQDVTAITDSAGRFTLKGLSVPYDLTAWSASGQWMHVYRGLTSSDLTLTPQADLSAPAARTTTVSGTLVGEAIPVENDQFVMVCLEGMHGLAARCDRVGPTESSFSLTAQWYGDTNLATTLHVLHVELDASAVPAAYPGYATLAVDLTDGVPLALTDPIDLGEPLETTSVALTVQAQDTIGQTIAAVEVAPNLGIKVMSFNDPETNYDVAMPVIPGVSYTFLSTTNLNGLAWVEVETETEVNLVVPAPPEIQSPAPDATGVTTATEFTATNPPGGPLTWIWTGASLMLAVTSMDTTVNMPDPSEYGFEIPGGVTMSVQVLASSGASGDAGTSTLDDYFTSILYVLFDGSEDYEGSGSVAISASPQFTTAP